MAKGAVQTCRLRMNVMVEGNGLRRGRWGLRGLQSRRCNREKEDSSGKQKGGDHKMMILTPAEKSFLDVFLYEATTAPFTGPATQTLHKIGVEYSDISYIAWAYGQDVPRTGMEIGHSADVAPPVPWKTREAALQRDQQIQHLREQQRKPLAALNGP